MLATLLESNAVPARRRGGALLSVVVHTGIILGAVAATGATRPAPPAPVDPVYIRMPISVGGERKPSTHTPPSPSHGVLPPVGPVDFPPIRPVQGTTIDLDGPITQVTIDPGTIAGPDSGIPTGVVSPVGPVTGPYLATQVERVAALRRSASPEYPEALRRAGLSGRVVVRFVVDTTGSVEPASIDVRESTHAAFEHAVRAVLPRLRFTPAEVGGRPVRMLVEMPFEFALDGR